MNDIISLDQQASYNLRAGVTVTWGNIRTNKFGFETVGTIGLIQSSGETTERTNICS